MGEKESTRTEFTVGFGLTFNNYYANFPSKTTDLVDDFIEHFEQYGFLGWKGKISPSDRVPLNNPNRQALIAKAEKFNLWHVHIGDPHWQTPFHGKYLTSDWVLHFSKISNYHIVLLELDSHNPLTLPSDKICEEGEV